MPETKTYTVTKRAGPKVAGVRVEPGQEIDLTDAQARAELAEGSIVPGGKADRRAEADGKAKGEKPVDPFEGTDELRHIRARARGLEEAPEERTEEPAKGKAEGRPAASPPAEGGGKPAAPPAPAGQPAA